MEFIENSALAHAILSQVTAHFNLGSCINEGDKDVFWNHDQRLEVILLFPPPQKKAAALKGIEGHPGCSWFS